MKYDKPAKGEEKRSHILLAQMICILAKFWEEKEIHILLQMMSVYLPT
jgi:hypothetical protein